MQFTIDWIQLAELAGAVQGLLLVAVLVAHRTNRTANRLLAALMAAFTVSLLSEVYYSAGLVRSLPHFFGISYPLPWTFGPLVYLYAVAAGDRRWRFGRRGALHFAPVAAVLVLTLPLYLQSGQEKIALFDRLTAGETPRLIQLLDPFKYLSGLAYSAATVAHLRTHRRRVEHSYSNTDRVNLRWLQSLAGAAAAIWLLATVTQIAGLLPSSVEPYGDRLVSLGVALVIFAIGYKGLHQPEIFRYDEPETADSTVTSAVIPSEVEGSAPAVIPSEVEGSAPAVIPSEVEGSALAASMPAHRRRALAEDVQPDRPEARYDRSGLGELETRRLKAALLGLMTAEHPHRDPELTLPGLADRLTTTPHKLSELLNRELLQTFYDFVNGYRVEEVCRRLADPRSKHLNILALALDAGFASKSTFNQAFKKLTGHTPSSYRKALEARKDPGG